jgi:ferric-dicitrate binding protein FerR (iron transport regulator)
MHPRTEIDRYLSFGLGAAAESRMRDHIGACQVCQDDYDLQVRLHRCLAGDPDAATAAEDERLVRRLMGQLEPDSPPDPGPAGWGWFDRLLWAPASVLAGSALILLIALVAGVGWLAAGPDSTGPTAAVLVARVTMARGVQIDGRRLTADQPGGMTLGDGQRVVVDNRGAAELSLRRGGKLRLYPSSEAELADDGRRVELRRGRVWCQIEPGKGPFRVQTPSALVDVAGTSFLVTIAASGTTSVQVDSGVVVVKDSQGRNETRVQAGQTTKVAPGKPPAAVRRTRQSVRSLDSEWDRIVQGLEQAVEELKDLFR